MTTYGLTFLYGRYRVPNRISNTLPLVLRFIPQSRQAESNCITLQWVSCGEAKLSQWKSPTENINMVLGAIRDEQGRVCILDDRLTRFIVFIATHTGCYVHNKKTTTLATLESTSRGVAWGWMCNFLWNHEFIVLRRRLGREYVNQYERLCMEGSQMR